MINCPWFCMASYSFRSSSDSSTSWMTTVRGGSLTSGLPSSSSDFSRLMEICFRSFCKRLWAKGKKPLYLSVNVFSTPSGDGTAILRGYPSNAKVYPFTHFSVILRPWVLFRSRLSSPRPPAQQSSALPADLIMLRLNEPKFKSERKLRLSRKKGKNKYKYKGVVVQSTRSTASWVEIHHMSQNKASKKVYESTCKKKKHANPWKRIEKCLHTQLINCIYYRLNPPTTRWSESCVLSGYPFAPKNKKHRGRMQKRWNDRERNFHYCNCLNFERCNFASGPNANVTLELVVLVLFGYSLGQKMLRKKFLFLVSG